MGLQQLRTLSALAEDLVVLLVPSLWFTMAYIFSSWKSSILCWHLWPPANTGAHDLMHTHIHIDTNKQINDYLFKTRISEQGVAP